LSSQFYKVFIYLYFVWFFKTYGFDAHAKSKVLGFGNVKVQDNIGLPHM
jgi:hypothetical protein